MLRVTPLRQLPKPGETGIVRSVSWLRAIAVFALALGCLQVSWARSQALGPAPASNGTDEPITAISSPPRIDPLKVKLGERLFADPRLSHDNSRSCSSCHDLSTNGASPRRRDVGLDGAELPLNTLTVFNAALSFRFGWEGKFRTSEVDTQRLAGKPEIMASSPAEVAEKLSADPDMRNNFFAAYGHRPDAHDIIDAIANFQRTLVTPGSRFDRWLAGDAARALDRRTGRIRIVQISGLRLLPSGRQYRRQSVPAPRHIPSSGVAGSCEFCAYRSRNVATTPPYFHDGSAPTLDDAVRKMGKAQLNTMLTDPQVTAIVAFLHSLTGNYRGTPVGVSP